MKCLRIFLLLICICSLDALAVNEYWEQRVSLFEILPGTSDDIIFLGNSITDGCEFSELFDNMKIKNRGINGDDIPGLLKRLKQVTRNNPKKIFLLIGINDISHNLSAEEIASNYEELVKRIHEESPSTKLFVQSILPVNNSFNRYKNIAGKDSVIIEVNDYIEKISRKYNDTFINLWPLFLDSENRLDKKFTNDGLHLSGEGYLVWKEALIPFVDE